MEPGVPARTTGITPATASGARGQNQTGKHYDTERYAGAQDHVQVAWMDV